MSTQTDYRAQAEAFAQWLVHSHPKGRRKFFNREIVRGQCPREAHDDRRPSFSFSIEKDAWACSCGSGKASELRAELAWEPPANGAASYSKPAQLQAPPDRPPDDIYRYANGNRKLKWRIPGQKSVILWRQESGRSGASGDVGIYRLDEALKSAGVIHVSESESDVDALCELGLVAIATPHGASSPWKELPPQLAGRTIVVWEHQDDAGRKYAFAMTAVARMGGADCAIARPKEPNKDVRDWILAGAQAAEISARADQALCDFPMAEPANDLLAADLPPPEYVINPIAIRSNLTLIQGEPKAGKSVITLFLAACAALGRWPAGRWSVPRPVRVLYITWEDGRRRIQKRLRQFLLGLGEPFKPITAIPNLFFYSKSKGAHKAPRIRLEDPAGRTMLQKLIKAHKAELVVLDTLSHLSTVNENDKEKMQPVMDALTDITEETEAAIVFNHHTGKEGRSGAKSTTYRSRGSSVIPAAPDVILHLGDRGKSNQTPCRFISREDDNDEFVLEYLPEGEDLVRFKLVDLEDEDGGNPTEKYAVQKSIIENLSSLCGSSPEGASRAQVSKACKLPYNTAKRHLDRMADDALIQRRQIETVKGLEWRYAPISHVWPGGAK